MKLDDLIGELQLSQSLLLENVKRFSPSNHKVQFHPELSPPGWHLGHCIYTESYWIREKVLNNINPVDQFKMLYISEISPKSTRGEGLPNILELCEWAEQIQAENRTLLMEKVHQDERNPLLKENFLIHFLIQHYAQHFETTMYICTQAKAKQAVEYEAEKQLAVKPLSRISHVIHAHKYRIGAESNHYPYDNEHPAFELPVDEFNIAVRPVTNAEYLGFIEDNGYCTPALWSTEGWRWRSENGIDTPQYWLRDPDQNLIAVDASGPQSLSADDPVYGISFYEANAFARWAGARLPHEYEWEVAKRSGALSADGEVWEWCNNYFHPYNGFKAFPYDGYSTPYFDNRHMVLRGASRYTLPAIRRSSFRNYFQANQRHMNAGIRLIFPKG